MRDFKADMDQWRNILCEEAPDKEIKRINAMEEALGGASDEAARVRALISRFESLAHYKAFDNLSLLLSAVGELDYPGAPAVDVLWRFEQIERERRERFIAYAKAIRAWLDESEEAGEADEYQETFAALGDPTPMKRWLAASLLKTLRELAYEPEDFFEEHSAEAYVEAAYRAVLRRPPTEEELRKGVQAGREPLLETLLNSAENLDRTRQSVGNPKDDAEYVQAAYEAVLYRSASPDDERFRVQELAEWKTREHLLAEIVNSAENRDHMQRRAAFILKRR